MTSVNEKDRIDTEVGQVDPIPPARLVGVSQVAMEVSPSLRPKDFGPVDEAARSESPLSTPRTVPLLRESGLFARKMNAPVAEEPLPKTETTADHIRRAFSAMIAEDDVAGIGKLFRNLPPGPLFEELFEAWRAYKRDKARKLEEERRFEELLRDEELHTTRDDLLNGRPRTVSQTLSVVPSIWRRILAAFQAAPWTNIGITMTHLLSYGGLFYFAILLPAISVSWIYLAGLSLFLLAGSIYRRWNVSIRLWIHQKTRRFLSNRVLTIFLETLFLPHQILGFLNPVNLAELFSLSYLLIQAWKSKKVKTAAVTYIAVRLISLVGLDISKYSPSTDDSTDAHAGITGFVKSIFKILTLQDLTKEEEFDLRSANLKLDSLTKVDRIIQVFESWFARLYDMVACRIWPDEPKYAVKRQIRDWLDRASKYLTRPIGTYSMEQSDYDAIRGLYHEGQTLKTQFALVADQAINQPLFLNLYAQFERVLEHAQTVVNSNKERPRPVGVLIHGIPQDGKTVFTQFLEEYYLTTRYPGFEFSALEHKSYNWTPNVNGRIDGVTSDHEVMIFDDLFQDPEAQPKESRMICNIIDKKPHMPEAASMAEKRKNAIRPNLVLVTTNLEIHDTMPLGILDPTAVPLRMGVVATFVDSPEKRPALGEDVTWEMVRDRRMMVTYLNRRKLATPTVMTASELIEVIMKQLDAAQRLYKANSGNVSVRMAEMRNDLNLMSTEDFDEALRNIKTVEESIAACGDSPAFATHKRVLEERLAVMRKNAHFAKNMPTLTAVNNLSTDAHERAQIASAANGVFGRYVDGGEVYFVPLEPMTWTEKFALLFRSKYTFSEGKVIVREKDVDITMTFDDTKRIEQVIDLTEEQMMFVALQRPHHVQWTSFLSLPAQLLVGDTPLFATLQSPFVCPDSLDSHPYLDFGVAFGGLFSAAVFGFAWPAAAALGLFSISSVASHYFDSSTADRFMRPASVRCDSDQEYKRRVFWKTMAVFVMLILVIFLAWWLGKDQTDAEYQKEKRKKKRRRLHPETVGEYKKERRKVAKRRVATEAEANEETDSDESESEAEATVVHGARDPMAIQTMNRVEANLGWCVRHAPPYMFSQNILGLCGEYALVSQHLFVGAGDDVLTVWFPNQQTVYPVSSLEKRPIPDCDLFVVRLPGQQFVSILSHFILDSDLPSFRGKLDVPVEYMTRVFDSKRQLIDKIPAPLRIEQVQDVKYNYAMTHSKVDGVTTPIYTRGFWEGLGDSVPGYCTGPWVWLNKQCDRKLIGAHFGSVGLAARGCLLTQEKLLPFVSVKLMSSVPTESHVGVAIDTSSDAFVSAMRECPYGFRFYGIVDKRDQLYLNTETRIVPSPLQQDIAPTTAPGPLGWYTDAHGVRRDALHNFLAKGGEKVFHISPGLLRRLCADHHLTYRKTISQHILTVAEVLNGIPGTNTNGVMFDTSAGVFWRKLAKKGKFPVLLKRELADGRVEVYGSDAFMEALRTLEKLCERMVPMVLFGDAGKDERRSLADVLEGKYRIVSSIAVHFLVLYRQYVGAFLDALRTSHPYGRSAVGIDATGPEWNMFWKYMSECGLKGIELDGKRFDLRLLRELRREFIRVANAWYRTFHNEKKHSREQKIRCHVMKCVLDHLHLLVDMVYYRTCGQSSGNPATAEENSWCSEIIAMTIFAILALRNGEEEWRENWNNIRHCEYGDDLLISVPNGFSWYNPKSFSEVAFEVFHMEYVLPDGSAPTSDYRPLEECKFISRGFYRIPGTDIRLGKMDIGDCVDIALWIKSKSTLDRRELIRQNVDSSLRELFCHGEEVFDHYKSIFNKRLIHEGLEPVLLDWTELFVRYTKKVC